MAIRTDVSIDWEASPRIITVASPSTTITIQDLADTLRSLEHLPNPGYDVFSHDYIADMAGKDAGVTGITLTLKNALIGFEDRAGPTWAECRISGGNLFAVDDVGSDLWPINGTDFVHVSFAQSTAATLVESGSGLDAGQDAKLTRIHALLDVIEGTLDHQEVMRLVLAAISGELEGAEPGSTEYTIYSLLGKLSGKPRITAQVDEHGNRESVVVDAS